MSLTELDRHAVRLAFERAAPAYDEHAVLQHEVEQRLLERVAYFQKNPASILDIGSGTGVACRALQRQFPESTVVGLDWSAAMLQHMQSHTGPGRPPLAVCADMQALPLAARSFDLVLSNLAMQWSPDLETLFRNVRRALRPGGLFLFTSFGPDTLRELRWAWAQADSSPHVNEFADMHDIGDVLVAAGFVDPVMDMELLTMEYRDVKSLMRDLKAIGAHNAAASRSQGLTGRGKFQRVLDAYEQFRNNGRYPASFEVIYGATFGPQEGQPVRTPEGETAEFSIEALREARRKGGLLKRWFITGTDTEIGKTRVTCALLRRLAAGGYRAAGMKPVASGCVRTPDGLRNEDALALMRASNVRLPYGWVNPLALEPAIAPHIAARQAGVAVDFDAIAACAAKIEADYLLIEGVGGWCVPMGEGRLLADLARRLAADVILVVGVRLGCINHALLSARQVERDGMRLLGWIANTIDPGMSAYTENLRTLEKMMPVPLLASLPWKPGGDKSEAVDLTLFNEWENSFSK